MATLKAIVGERASMSYFLFGDVIAEFDDVDVSQLPESGVLCCSKRRGLSRRVIEVWQKIPSGERAILSGRIKRIGCHPWIDKWLRARHITACAGEDHLLFVSPKRADLADHDALDGVIAHEFAHAILDHTALNSPTIQQRLLQEIEADDKAAGWGFRVDGASLLVYTYLEHLRNGGDSRDIETLTRLEQSERARAALAFVDEVRAKGVASGPRLS